MHNASKRAHSYIIRDIFKYKGLIIGSPTYNNRLFPEISAILEKIEERDMKNRYLSYFGSFTWAGAAVKRIAKFAETTNFEIIGEPVEMKQAMNIPTYEGCIKLGKAMADRLKQDR